MLTTIFFLQLVFMNHVPFTENINLHIPLNEQVNNLKNARENILANNKEIIPKLKKLVQSKCFSKIKINLDKPCTTLNLLKKCKFNACLVPRTNINEEKDLCKSGIVFNNKCIFKDDHDQEAIGVNLEIAQQIYSGYKKGAAEIWNEIYKTAQGNEILSKMISGVHYSIMIHMSIFYKYIFNEYWSNPLLYSHKRNETYYQNLLFAYTMVIKAIKRLNNNYFKCSLQLDGNDQKILKDLIEQVQGQDYDLPTGLRLGDYQKKFKKIFDILNCIECDKCKLWGMIQFDGVKTALDIISGKTTQLKGRELVNLFQLFNKLGSSLIYSQALDVKIKHRYVYFLLLYIIEIITIFLSLTLFFIVTRGGRKEKIKNKIN